MLREFVCIAGAADIDDSPLPDDVAAGVRPAHDGRLPREAPPPLEISSAPRLSPRWSPPAGTTPRSKRSADALATALNAERITCLGQGACMPGAPASPTRSPHSWPNTKQSLARRGFDGGSGRCTIPTNARAREAAATSHDRAITNAGLDPSLAKHLLSPNSGLGGDAGDGPWEQFLGIHSRRPGARDPTFASPLGKATALRRESDRATALPPGSRDVKARARKTNLLLRVS